MNLMNSKPISGKENIFGNVTLFSPLSIHLVFISALPLLLFSSLKFLILIMMFSTLFTILQIDEKSYCIPIMATCTKEVDRHTKLGHVKVVKLDGFTKQEDEISLLKHIRELVKVDPLTITSSNENCFRSSVKESPYQPKFCSNFLMEAPWSEGRKNSDHFEEVNDINNLCPKHAQMGLMAPKFGQI